MYKLHTFLYDYSLLDYVCYIRYYFPLDREKDDFLLMVRPFEIVTLKRAIMTAIELGYGREVTSPADDEIDEGLAELNQKKTR